MTKNGYYTDLDGEQWPCEVIEEMETQVKVRLPEETARVLRLNEELWLPRYHVTIESD